VLQAYLDGELGVQDTGRVVEHLAHCERCRIEVDITQRVIDSIRRQRPELAPELHDRLTAMVDELAPPTLDSGN